MHYVYVIRCSDDTLYTGYTTDIKRRIKEHNNGKGAKYTRGRTPVVLKYVELHSSRSCAMSSEYKIKQRKKKNKEKLTDSRQTVRVKFCEDCL